MTQQCGIAIYTVIAYRWGYLNDHNYQVGAFLNKDYAIDVAKTACEDRGGKYAVAVYEWYEPTDEQKKDPTYVLDYSISKGTPIYYAPSMLGESSLSNDPQVEAAKKLAYRVSSLVAQGGDYEFDEALSKNVFKSILTQEEGGLAPWLLKELIDYELDLKTDEILKEYRDLYPLTKDEKGQPIFEKTTPEQSAYLDQLFNNERQKIEKHYSLAAISARHDAAKSKV